MLFFSIVLIASGICFADAVSSGAPAAACDNLTPSPSQHGNPQTSEVPYEIDLTQFEDDNGTYVYTPGKTYTLTFSGINGEEFRGFFVQSRLASDGTTRVGTFDAIQERTRLSSCERREDGVTHAHPSTNDIIDFTSRMMNWTAPSSGTGPIRFAFAVVVTRPGMTWADQRSDMVMEAVNNDNNNNNDNDNDNNDNDNNNNNDNDNDNNDNDNNNNNDNDNDNNDNDNNNNNNDNDNNNNDNNNTEGSASALFVSMASLLLACVGALLL